MVTSPKGGEGTVVFEGAVENYGEMWLANNGEEKKIEASKTKVVFNSTVLNGIDEETVNEENVGKIYCAGLYEGNSSVEFNGKVTNEGEITIQPAVKLIENGKIWPYDFPGGTKYPAHEVNSVKVSAVDIDNNGTIVVDKYTGLNVAGAVANKGAITVNSANIDDNSKSGVDGLLMIENGASVSNSGVVENFGVITNRGSLRNVAEEADIIDHIGCQFGGNKAGGIGEYICEVEDEDVEKEGDRLEYAMGPDMPTTTVKFVGAGRTDGQAENVYVYDLGKYGQTAFNYDFIIATDDASAVNLNATDENGNAVPVTINGKLTVEGDKDAKSTLHLSEIILTVNEAVTVNGEMYVNPTDADAKTTEAATKVAFTAKQNMDVNGIFEVETFARTAMAADLNIAEGATGTFNYATYTKVDKVININGKFERVLSSGNSSSNPAQVWCSDYKLGSKADVTNGDPQK